MSSRLLAAPPPFAWGIVATAAFCGAGAATPLLGVLSCAAVAALGGYRRDACTAAFWAGLLVGLAITFAIAVLTTDLYSAMLGAVLLGLAMHATGMASYTLASWAWCWRYRRAGG
ncbi:hypothetical protein [Pseudoduganella chitinolytica]|uniref:Uncharacterized protein n=1 Tax=Pseudoduganella chitinolytica TaxID=34070 RepID=A0ABY8BEL1_9BURK|nr:hypothetical protein [Pseudoduganella chitinolytica]WEF33433.1 hypothetical protein PX653_01170 [Pseudoduganella chitinolytica]